MRAFVDKTLEGKDGVLSVSIGHYFPYADVPELGGRILVITDNDKANADRLSTEIGHEFIAMRGQTAPDHLATDEGISAALASNASPVAMADAADNTSILRRLIERDVDDAAIGPTGTRSLSGCVSMRGSVRAFGCGSRQRWPDIRPIGPRPSGWNCSTTWA